jgi:aspartate/methionine/tyrosine aminotransferase
VLRPGFEPGDRVGVAIPGYPAYRNILTALDIEPVLIAVGENAHYQPTPELLIDLGKLDGLIVASPANPTGTMISAIDLARLAEYCSERGIRLISDEIYHGITYETAAATARAYGRGAIIVNSFSKYYSMTGWRLGWMLVPSPARSSAWRRTSTFRRRRLSRKTVLSASI